jgi:glycosyltransferase involved in cell wall biosynthesis
MMSTSSEDKASQRSAAQRLRHRLGEIVRRSAKRGLPYYRWLLPTRLRGLAPNRLRRGVKKALGIPEPIDRANEAAIRIQGLVTRLTELGFVERALDDLDRLSRGVEVEEKGPASWALAVWHANQQSAEAAREALIYLDRALSEVTDADLSRRGAVLRAECYVTLGDLSAARAIIDSALTTAQHPDLFLAAANAHPEPLERLAWVNKALRHYDLPEVSLLPRSCYSLYDRLAPAGPLQTAAGPKVSVIVPTFNAAEHIATAMEALIAQTWTNLEVIVVDDHSTDDTPDIIASFSARDPRIRLIRATQNRGSYVARNIALREAVGEFVTTHDSDDWSHPQKIELQVRHLIAHQTVVANVSQQARVTSDLFFCRRGNPGFYIFDNMSSLMFRREPVTNQLGFWDPVRMAADSEFIQRILNSFDDTSVASLTAGPLSFQRQTDSSLTGSSAFGYHGFLMGARRAYHHASRRYHQVAKRLYYEFPQTKRPFAVPEPMRPEREVAMGERRAFDVIFVSDFRMPGNFEARNVKHLEEETQRSRRVGLVQMATYDFDPAAQILPVFRSLEDAAEVEFVVAGERVSCDRLVVLDASVLEEFQCFVPDVESKEIQLLVDDIAQGTADVGASASMETCMKNVERYFGKSGDVVRKAAIRNDSTQS